MPAAEETTALRKLQVYGCLVLAHELLGKVRLLMDRQAFNEALEEIWKVVREANRCIDVDAPWALRKTDPEAMANVLYVMAEIIRHLAILLWPFMPDSSDRLLDQLAVPAEARAFDALVEGHSVAPGTSLPKPEGVFPRFAYPDAG